MKRIYLAVTLFVALMSLCSATGRAQESLFLNPAYPTGAEPLSAAAGDFNGDGKPDLVIANSGANTVSILLNNGNGTFAAKVDYPAGIGPFSVAAGDFDGDGKPDIAVVNFVSNTVSVLLNKGDGTLAPGVDYPTGSYPRSVTVGDFNGDDKPDIVIANYGDSTASVLLNNGNGTFAAKVDYPTGVSPTCVTIGDFNGDGKPDLVISNFGFYNYLTTNDDSTISVLLNNGNGTFAAKVDYLAGIDPISVAIGDFDGDGKTDIVTANRGNNTVSILFNKGNGTFAAKTDYPTGVYPVFAAAGDFNKDGKPDLVIANYADNTMSVLLNKGNGTFSAQVNYPTGVSPNSFVVGDFNGDNKPDIVTANYGADTASVFLGDGTGTFAATVNFADTSYAVAAGDFNGDGKPDLVLAPGGNYVSVLLNKGNGTFGAKVNYDTGYLSHFIVVGDFNGDGKLDIVTANFGVYNENTRYYDDSSVSVLLGKGDGTFAAKVDYPIGKSRISDVPISVALGDFNGDGKPDIAVISLIDNIVSVLLNKGNGTFAAKVDYPTGNSPLSVAAGDFNGDGKTDLVIANQGVYSQATQNYNNSSVSILLGRGDGTFAAKVDYPTDNDPLFVTAGDFNGDGKTDLVTANFGGYNPITGKYDSTTSVLLNNGDGTFALKADYAVGFHPLAVAAGDLDGDGILDIVTANPDSGSISILRGKGNGTFGERVDYSTNPYPSYAGGAGSASIAVSDFDGDGKTDLAVTTLKVSVLLNTAVRSVVSGNLTLEGIFASASAQPVTFTFRSPGFPDFAPTLNVLPSGNFAVNLPKRGGTLHIKGSKYLAANVNVDATAGNVSGISATLSAGDADNNNIVNFDDFLILLNAFGSSEMVSGSGYDANADFNGDGTVKFDDFLLLLNNFGSAGMP